MSDPRMIPADDARVTLDAAIQAGGYGYSFPNTYVRDLAHTVIEQAAQIERLQDGLREIEEWELTASSIIANLVESGVILEEDMQ